MNEHPGEALKRMLTERGWTQTHLAHIINEPPTVVNTIVLGKRDISATASIALGVAFGIPEDHFWQLQSAYDFAKAERPKDDISLRAQYPVREMQRRNWIKDGTPEEVASFLTAASSSFKFKKTGTSTEISPVQSVWLARVVQLAKATIVSDYTARNLRNGLATLKELTLTPEGAAGVPKLLREAGVRFIIVEPLPSGKIDGVTFWLNKNSPVVALSMRFDRIDNFWFVLRHELEHVLQGHGIDGGMIDEFDGNSTTTDVPEEEHIANLAAADFCVPADKMASFLARKYPLYYENDILAFAKLNNVHPGFVVGQVQFKTGRYEYLKKHQVRIRHFVLPGAMADGWGQTIPI